MDLDDHVTIATPEGVELALVLAGLGSRFIAGSIDAVIQLFSILILYLLTVALTGAHGLLAAVFVVLSFGILLFYNTVFELLAAGRTPGKSLSHLRVVRSSGVPVDLAASAIRNLARLLDGPLLLYLPTVISIALSPRNQRPGDMAAGTIVIREQRLTRPGVIPERPPGEPARWDVSALSAQELAAVRRFLERRETLDRGARHELALRLASGLRSKVSGAPERLEAERFLEALAATKTERR